MSRLVCGGIAAAGLAGLLTGCGGEGGGVVVNLYNAPQENLGKIVERCNELADGEYRIVLNTLPRDADSQREQLVRRLAAGDEGMDVLGLDVTWTAELASAEWIEPWPDDLRRQAEEGVLEAPLKTATYEGELYAAPYNTNVQLLWYRSDLMPEPAETWRELIDTAERLAAEDRPHYVEVTGAQYEGLVVWFNSMIESAGGSILNEAGDKVELGEPAVTAMEEIRDFSRSAAADPSLSNTQEDQARLAMESGVAFAQVNWPFVYASMVANEPGIAEDFEWAPYPGIDGPGRSPLGGANFGISSYSANKAASFDAALCLRDEESQLMAAVNDGLPPTIESVYDDPQMAEAYPMRDAILAALETAAPRPVTPVYQNVSTVTSALLSPPASIDPEPTAQAMRDQLVQALESRGVLP
ncbi:carbohydrate ABC transporter substrate-binding protein, CUT1 family (TC 3.A.1.1.-) [Stackebrandtia albiflava]|uniref:Carbohydrate ABC transporter substrate-binding protein, CUT1 family (TC 3.A.1.1.-) n=1 Tax=Stackebrandtia albiflava TaxID=406432 RepID=A0A562UYW5_9ACTN|nr:ABC transporter substrate-binding protein [Stackebrandtia albiflava]TWJ10830.1 carbohydrate ABC transporter substrate-binding protein, CUT1 family (TC 3.A.1.1.-) [Stackebrandtia albiflava]